MEPRSQKYTRRGVKGFSVVLAIGAAAGITSLVQQTVSGDGPKDVWEWVGFLIIFVPSCILIRLCWRTFTKYSRNLIRFYSFLGALLLPMTFDGDPQPRSYGLEQAVSISEKFAIFRSDISFLLLGVAYVALSSFLIRASLPASDRWPPDSPRGTTMGVASFAVLFGLSIMTELGRAFGPPWFLNDLDRQDWMALSFFGSIPLAFLCYFFVNWLLLKIIAKINPMPEKEEAEVDRKGNPIREATAAEQSLYL